MIWSALVMFMFALVVRSLQLTTVGSSCRHDVYMSLLEMDDTFTVDLLRSGSSLRY